MGEQKNNPFVACYHTFSCQIDTGYSFPKSYCPCRLKGCNAIGPQSPLLLGVRRRYFSKSHLKAAQYLFEKLEYISIKSKRPKGVGVLLRNMMYPFEWPLFYFIKQTMGGCQMGDFFLLLSVWIGGLITIFKKNRWKNWLTEQIADNSGSKFHKISSHLIILG